MLFEADVAALKACLQANGAPTAFPSQCPGGIDWSFQTFVPKSPVDVARPTPYAYYGVFYFDFLSTIRLLWGDDFTPDLPPVNDTKALMLPTLEQTYERLKPLADTGMNRQRSAFAAYKAAVMLQLFFGERSLDKFSMLKLYQRYVPDFAFKERGEQIIRERLSACYLHNPPDFRALSYYLAFVEAALNLVRREAKSS